MSIHHAPPPTPKARKRRKRDRVKQGQKLHHQTTSTPKPMAKQSYPKDLSFYEPKPKINKLQNPNWVYPITKSVQRAEMKTRRMGRRDVERDPWRRKLGRKVISFFFFLIGNGNG